MKSASKNSEVRNSWRAQAMRGVWPLVIGILVTSHSQASAQERDYFPLHDASRWVYLVSGPIGNERTEEVWGSSDSQFGGQERITMDNYLFGFFPSAVTFFGDANGTVEFGAKGQTGMWYPWSELSPGVEVPIILPAFIADCVHGSEGVMAIGGPIEVPAGIFEDVAVITYHTHPCEDHGVLSEVMAPGVGLIQRRVLTFAGVQTWSLEYAEVGGRVYDRSSSNQGRFASGSGVDGKLSIAPVAAGTWGAIKAAFRR